MEFLHPKKSSIGLDMAPLIDVVFLLLIFFILTSSFLHPSLELKLPKAVQSTETQPEHIVISVDKKQGIYVNTAQVVIESLKDHLEPLLASRKEKERDIHLRGDENMPYKLFVQIMDQARQAGAGQMNIVHLTEDAG